MDKNVMKQQFNLAQEMMSINDGIVYLSQNPVTVKQPGDVDTVGLGSMLNSLVKSVSLSAARKMAKGTYNDIESAINDSLKQHAQQNTYARFF